MTSHKQYLQAAWGVAIDGVLVYGACSPRIVSSYTMYLAIDVEVYVVVSLHLVWVARTGVNVALIIVPCTETEGLVATDAYALAGIVGEREPTQIASVAVVLGDNVV